MLKRFIYLVLIEISYLAFSFAIAMAYGQWSEEGEIIRTIARSICLLMYGLFYLKFFHYPETGGTQAGLFRPSFLVAVGCLLLFAVMDSNGMNESAGWQKMFAVSGIIAGFREELLYRGMVQNILQNRYGYRFGLIAASLLFALSHIQYIYYGQLNGLLLIACAGIIFGCVYIYSRSILVTALIHGLYDAMISVDFIAYKLGARLELPLFIGITLFFISLVRKQLAGNKKPGKVGSL